MEYFLLDDNACPSKCKRSGEILVKVIHPPCPSSTIVVLQKSGKISTDMVLISCVSMADMVNYNS